MHFEHSAPEKDTQQVTSVYSYGLNDKHGVLVMIGAASLEDAKHALELKYGAERLRFVRPGAVMGHKDG